MFDAVLPALQGYADPLPWFIAGPLIGLFVPIFLLLTGKELGVSSSFRHTCAALLPSKKSIPYLNYKWKEQGLWQLVFVVGIGLGGFVALQFLGGGGIPFVDPQASQSWVGWLSLFIGGMLVGFGTRWADGCTSGHTINGIAQLQWTSLVASICFVVGGVGASLVHRFLLGGLVP